MPMALVKICGATSSNIGWSSMAEISGSVGCTAKNVIGKNKTSHETIPVSIANANALDIDVMLNDFTTVVM